MIERKLIWLHGWKGLNPESQNYNLIKSLGDDRLEAMDSCKLSFCFFLLPLDAEAEMELDVL